MLEVSSKSQNLQPVVKHDYDCWKCQKYYGSIDRGNVPIVKCHCCVIKASTMISYTRTGVQSSQNTSMCVFVSNNLFQGLAFTLIYRIPEFIQISFYFV
jgi:ribosomal protein L37AE/L43A